MNNPAAPRLPLLSTAEAKRRAAQVGLLEPLAELNIFRVLLHRPKLAQCVSELLVTLLFRNKLDPRLRELIIMRIGWKTGSIYEWTQHWKVALGDLECCTREELLAVREWRRASPAVLGVVDRAVLAATDEVLDSGAISAETWEMCEALLRGDAVSDGDGDGNDNENRSDAGTAQLLELSAVIGAWSLVSQLLHSLQVPLEPDMLPGWPPDGARPAAWRLAPTQRQWLAPVPPGTRTGGSASVSFARGLTADALPTDCAALVLRKPRLLELQRLPVPPLGRDDALLRLEACGLCGTDHEQFLGDIPCPYPFIPGHEAVGVIEAIGAGAAERWGVTAGERVAVEVFQACGSCHSCCDGAYNHCDEHGIADMYGFTGLRKKDVKLWGGYAAYQYLSPHSILHRVPASLSPIVATLFNPLGAGVRWGAELPGTKPGDIVVIMGPGIRGLCCAVAAKEAGAATVIITGKGPFDHERLQLAMRFGADHAVDIEEEDPVDVLERVAGGRLADVVINVTVRAPGALGQAVSLARPGGTLVLAGVCGFQQEYPDFHPDQLVYKELRVLGALGVDRPAYARALRILESRKYPFEELPRRIASADDASQVGDLLLTMAGQSRASAGAEALRPVHAVILPPGTSARL